MTLRKGATEGLLLDALAIYRLWRLAGRDDITEGPRARLNSWIWDRARADYHGPPNEPMPVPKAIVLLECPWCLGFWITVAVTAARTTPAGRRAWEAARIPLAISTTVGLIAGLEDG